MYNLPKLLLIYLLLYLLLINNTNLALAQNSPKQSFQIKQFVDNHKVRAWLIPDESAKLVSISAFFPLTQNMLHLPTKAVFHMAELLLLRDTTDIYFEQFEQQLLDMSVSISARITYRGLYLQFSSLDKHLTQALELLKQSMYQPKIHNDLLTQEKEIFSNSINEERKNPYNISTNTLFTKTIKPQFIHLFTPYQLTQHDIDVITPQVIRNLAHDIFRNDNIRLTILGNLSVKQAENIVQNLLFNSYATNDSDPGSDPAPDPDYNSENLPHILINNLPNSNITFHKKNIAQESITFAFKSPSYSSPDIYSFLVLNKILGGGLNSRLSKSLRKNKGLTYGIHTDILELSHEGLFVGSTKTSDTSLALKIIQNTLQNLYQNGVTEQEVNDARTYMLGSLSSLFTKSSRITSVFNGFNVKNRSTLYLQDRIALFNNVSRETVNLSIKKYLDPNNMFIIQLKTLPNNNKTSQLQ